MSKDGRTWLSHTTLELMERCPRCFWLQLRKDIRQPEGIVSKLANRYDHIMKQYFDAYRKTGQIPPLVSADLTGTLENPFTETYFMRIDTQYGFFGKLDECLISPDGAHIPVDFKTSSTDPRERDILPAYRSQIDDYLFLLEANRKRTGGYGYLVFLYPECSESLHDAFPMAIHTVRVAGNPESTMTRINRAMEILGEPIPEAHPDCRFCLWYRDVSVSVG